MSTFVYGGWWVVKKAQNSVYIVIEWPLLSLRYCQHYKSLVLISLEYVSLLPMDHYILIYKWEKTDFFEITLIASVMLWISLLRVIIELNYSLKIAIFEPSSFTLFADHVLMISLCDTVFYRINIRSHKPMGSSKPRIIESVDRYGNSEFGLLCWIKGL